jgi:hypothetical protein
LSQCHDQLQWTNDDATQSFLTEAMLGDLDQCQRLCEQLRTGEASRGVARQFATA